MNNQHAGGGPVVTMSGSFGAGFADKDQAPSTWDRASCENKKNRRRYPRTGVRGSIFANSYSLVLRRCFLSP